MQICRLISHILLFAIFCPLILGQDDRAELAKTTQEKSKKTLGNLYKGSYALIIGESSYFNGWQELRGVSEDIPEVKNALEKQGFKVRVEKNLNKDDLEKAIKTFIDDYGYEYENRLLIYYAGHGHTLPSADKRGEIGYIVPIDAPLSKPNEIAFKQKAIPIDDFQNYAGKIQAKHALFVFDSCFSGKIVSRSPVEVPDFIVENVEKPVRQFITAGTAEQTVPDKSDFRRLFVRGLDGEADEDGDGFILGSELAKFLSRELTNYSRRKQTPQYGKILNPDLDRGDFVFLNPNPPKKPKTPISKPDSPESDKRSLPQKLSKTLSVNKFTKTDICVNPATELLITASGSIYVGPNIGNKTPEGKDSFQLGFVLTSPIFDKYYIERSIPHGALMCRMDYEEKWRYCSTSQNLKAEKKGCLIFEINDQPQDDNRGSYTVTVKEL